MNNHIDISQAVLKKILRSNQAQDRIKAESYGLILQGKNSALYCFASSHSYDPGNPMMRGVKALWQTYLAMTAQKKRHVFIEGGHIRSYSSITNAVQRDGEMGLVSFLAKQSHVRCSSPEPNVKKEVTLLMKKFSREAIIYYYLARSIFQWHRVTDKGRLPLKKYLPRLHETDRSVLRWSSDCFTLEMFNKLHKHFFIDKTPNAFFFRKILSPHTKTTLINRIACESTYIRDKSILTALYRAWQKKEDVFCIYGSAHIDNLGLALYKFWR